MRNKSVRTLQVVGLVGVALSALIGLGRIAQAKIEKGDWASYASVEASTRYSPLNQINKDTVKNLRIAWRQSVTPPEVRQRLDAPLPAASANTPLKIGNLLYMTTGIGTVAALDPATGKTVWFDVPPEATGKGNTRGAPKRGITYWTDGKSDQRIIAVTGDYLVSLDAKTGARKSEFGHGGAVSLLEGYRRPATSFAWGSAPVVVRDVIVVGGMGGPMGDGYSETMLVRKEGSPANIRGYDVRTGKLRWTFDTIPQAGEFGNDTWLNESWKYTGDANAWAQITGDNELGYVYVPTGSATNDYWGGERPGDDLFAESLICLDVRTGKRVWHFQAVHHGLWDYDFPAAPILADIKVDGQRIKAVAQISKQGFTYVFDRVTGKPVWPIEERPVPKGDVPGEWYSPTQPFPTKPPAYERQGVTVDDLIDWTPELRAEALAIINQYRYGPLFAPPSLPDGEDGKKGTISEPGASSTDWESGALDPDSGILYIATASSTHVLELVPSKNPKTDLRYVRKMNPSLVPGPQGLPSSLKPPYGYVTAIDLNKGEILWKVANGDGPRNHPAIKHLNLPPLGNPGRSGVMLTKELLFHGEGHSQQFLMKGGGGKMFRAFDSKTGKVVWETELPGEAMSAPMTYLFNGKQYIALTIGGGGMRAELIALALP